LWGRRFPDIGSGGGVNAREAGMTVLDQVRSFVSRLAPDGVCDDCIADRLGLSVRQHANHKTRELAGSPGFERSKDRCSLCGSEKLTIRRSR
jgi:hypothetical protein